MSEAPPEFVAQHAPALARLCKRAGGARWNLGDESLRDAAYRGARAAGVLDRAGVDSFIDALHAEDLSLAIACQAGESAPWEHFITSFRPALYAAARAIAGDEARGRELADSIWAEMYGMEVRDGRRRSILSYFHGRSSLLTWMRAVLAQRHVDYIRSQSRIAPLDDQLEQATEHRRRSWRGIRLRPRPLRGDAGQGARRGAQVARAAGPDADGVLLPARSSLKEIGRVMNEHESTVSRRLARTRDYLKREIERTLHDGDKLSQDQIRLCYDWAAGDLQIDLSRALPDVK